MIKQKILWFGDIGRRNSFSRISESVIPHLSEFYDVYILAPPKNLIIDELVITDYKKIFHIGDPNSLGFNFETFKKIVPNAPENQLMMKYSLLQAGFICEDQKIDWLIFLGGNNVIEWFMRLINQKRTCIPCKIAIWTPFDYIPVLKNIENMYKADKLITTNPIMLNILKSLKDSSNLDWIHHGISPCFVNVGKKKAVKELNKIGDMFYKFSSISVKDNIILNANNFVERKRLDLTMETFIILYNDTSFKKVKLWLHTNTKAEGFDKFLEKYENYINTGHVIISHNNATLEIVNWIYNACSVGLQTSSGEGWSLTNCEHEIVGNIQVVPDFLATKYNFEKTGILIPVVETETKDEIGNSITIGIIDPVIAAHKVKLAINKNEYIKSDKGINTWETAAKKLHKILLIS